MLANGGGRTGRRHSCRRGSFGKWVEDGTDGRFGARRADLLLIRHPGNVVSRGCGRPCWRGYCEGGPSSDSLGLVGPRTVAGMADRQQIRADIREFLTTRRARISPEQAGLRTFGGSRRVKGLRREDVATVAGISIEYSPRLERGNVSGVSESVLDGIAQALQLTDDERDHLHALVRTASTRSTQRRRPSQVRIRPTVQRILDSLLMAPAFVVDGRLDILAANDLGRALYAPLYDDPVQPPNHARFLFLDPRAGDFWRDWGQAADDAVALLRASAGRDPYDRQLSDLIGQLSTRSDDFRVRWASHDVKAQLTGAKRIHHPLVGDLELPFESAPLPLDPGQHLVIYSPEPDTASYAAVQILASWSATHAVDAASQQLPDSATGSEPRPGRDRP